MRRLAAVVASLCLLGSAARAGERPHEATGQAQTAGGQAHDASRLAAARAAVDRREYDAALPLYRSLSSERPNDDDLLIELARVLGFADRNADAAATYRRVLEVAPQRRADVRRSLAWQTLWAGDPGEAEKFFLESAQHDPDPADAWRGVAESRQQRDDLHGALVAYREALRLDPDDATNARRAAQILVWLGRHDEGIDAFRALLERDRDDRHSRLGLARALNDAGRHREAIAEYRRVAATTDMHERVAAGVDRHRSGLALDADSRFDYARALRWSGFDDLADEELAALDQPEARWLRNYRTARERARWWSTEWSTSTDADDLDSRALRVAAGWHFDGGAALETSLRRVRLEGPDLDGDGVPRKPRRNAQVHGTRWETRASARLGAPDSRWGVAWPSATIAWNGYDDWEPLTGAARVRWLPRDSLRIDLEWQRDTVETPTAIDERVRVDVTSIGVDWQPSIPWTIAGSLAHFRFDDGNERARVYARVERTILGAPRVRAGIEALAFDSSAPRGKLLDPDPPFRRVAWRGYWNPDRYHEVRAFVSAEHDWREWQLQGRLGLGTARAVDGWHNRTSARPHLWELVIVRDLLPTLQLRAQIGGSGSEMGLSGGGSGYWRRFANISITGWF